ncbi:MAG: hypothetical protein A2Y84_00720 [Candidatus Colwellbacteria bacterium RBG_13_48_8]|uniref:YdbS-like PH domain-containing protein n=1 Tax=Candidatus Colwellbacteria bacterium RBG_13_48_8 TaxID=1797685 RepID=A0A1G1YXF4_9BACT|nr:MAG: hypothetical protein A2Y84_00720 [Candidatus Colwellbacteria bacterium RBG_13_48_8]
MKKLDPKAFWLFLFNYSWSGWIVLGFLWANFYTLLSNFWGIAASVFLIILWVVWAKLAYNFYRYELREDGFRKELGVIWKKYVTIPYDRIQNVDIYRGVLARFLGLSDLHIQTAGSSYSPQGKFGMSAEGRLPGLSKEEAERVRDELVSRAKPSGHQGL